MSDRPKVSVLVSTYQRAAELPKLVAALEQQTFPREDMEVVFVDNGSTDETSALLTRLANASPLRLRHIRLDRNDGSSGGRNAGWKIARGELIAFTDDDCLPEPDWLKEGVAAMDEDVVLVQGRTMPQRKVRALERSAGSARNDGLYPTCNIIYRREALEESGGFDRDDGARLGFKPGSFGSGYGFGEDTLLAWRVSRGRKVAFANDAVVRHGVVRPPIREYVLRNWVVGGFPALIRQVPELRGTLLRTKAFLGYRRLPLYATAAAGGFGLRSIVIASAAWWVTARSLDARRRGGPPRRKVASVPIEMAVDVVSAAALAWGSLRARTIVL